MTGAFFFIAKVVIKTRRLVKGVDIMKLKLAGYAIFGIAVMAEIALISLLETTISIKAEKQI